MPAFQAINLEPEENVDEQIDTTKELHVDEALKRFQNALRLHAQGPRSRDAANAAYKELFASEIFQYREARSDYDRAERQAKGEAEPQALEFTAGLDIDAGGADGIAASLSLALYLGYKNYGEFFLDKLKDLRETDPYLKSKKVLSIHENGADQVLDYWAKALDQDPSDPEVWRKAARFSAALNSTRLKRFCLEAAIELDDDPAVADVEPPSIAEGLAGEQLKEQLHILGDNMALTHPIMNPWTTKEMPAIMKRLLDPIPSLPDPTQTMTPPPSSPDEPKLLEDKKDGSDSGPVQETKTVTSWSQLGRELMYHIEDTATSQLACEASLESSPDTEMASESKAADASEQANKEASQDGPVGDSITVSTEVQEKQATKEETESPITADKNEEKQPDRGSSAPTTRKRSQSVAGLVDAGDEEAVPEKRSKRVRRRETTDAGEAAAPAAKAASQLQPYQEADAHLFQATKNILENLGVEDKSTLDRLTELQESAASEDRMAGLTPLASKDLRAAVTSHADETARILLNKEEKAPLGLSSFLEHAKSGSQDQSTTKFFDECKGIKAFVEKINKHSSWMSGADTAFEWVRAISQSYASEKWSDDMKTLVVQMLNQLHAGLYERITTELEYAQGSPKELEEIESLVLMLFELHVDIYERINNPSSVVEYATRMEIKDRLNRWLRVASAYVHAMDRPASDPLCIRFMWASVMTAALADQPVREHMLMMWTSLRDFLTKHEAETILLPNNVVMPIVSADAADREISKLNTMDFFLGLFQDEMENPVGVIETLEPVLNPSSVHVVTEETPPTGEEKESTPANGDKESTPAEAAEEKEEKTTPGGEAEEEAQKSQPIAECAGQGLRDLWKFLDSSSTELRLFLWSQLGLAYEAIDFKTKTFSSKLKSIEMIMDDLEGETYAKTTDDSRRLLLLRTLKSLDEQLIQALSMALNEPTAFEILDEDHFRTSTAALAKANCLLHVATLFEDEVRAGISTTSSTNKTFQSMSNRLREMQIRAWTLQYTVINEAMKQQGSFIAPDSERAGFLGAVHQVIGVRKFCKVSNKIFLNLMRRELLRMKDLEHWEDYLEQVLYDLYGLKLGVSAWGVQEHDCPVEDLQKSKTISLVERVMVLAHRMPMKDLLKSDLRAAIDHMQQTIGQLKSNPQMTHNLRNFTEYLKKPIHPMRLYRALSGSVDLDAVTVPPRSDAILAKYGWFFLLGVMSLTKFKGVDLNRRQTPGATDDLRIGATYLRLQLQFTPDRWDAWFRLAECFDYELDEAVLWSADKINKDRAELLKFQRHAIHCYSLALSHSYNVDIEAYEGDPLHDLYHRFGMRMYASSREPFAMEPFQHSEQERFFIETMGNGTFKRIVHDEMTKYKVWKYAARLFRMAMKRQPNNWKNPFMLAKCYWKMFTTKNEDLDSTDQKARLSAQKVIDVVKKSVDVAYNARKSKRSEPILEPHYKIVSILHKMVKRGDVEAKEAASILSEQPFGVPISEDDHYAAFTEPEDWEEYAIANLNKLADKDRSNWQHRIIMRHAKILFEETTGSEISDPVNNAKSAFNVLTDSMLTKTMVMNVWKCEAERPGRHHVYTERYTRFVTDLLLIMTDRVNMEQLLKRIRKKSADFYHFNDMWQWCCHQFVKILRKTYDIHEVTEEVFKSMSTEEFEIVTERITEWAAAGDGPHTAVFSCLKDTIEVKKLNGGLTRAGPIDDLINDCYSQIYLSVHDSLPGLDPAKIIEERNKAKEAAAEAGVNPDGGAKPANALSGLLNPQEGQDSRRTTPTPQESEKPEAGPKVRRTGIRRPDVLRKAEQAVMRSMEPRVGPTKSRLGSISSKRGSQTPVAHMSDEGSDDDGPDAQVRREHEEGMDVDMKDVDGEEHHDDEHAGSDGESLGEHDEEDEDDESDLSDAPEGSDEEMPPSLMFPNLLGQAAAESSGEEADSEDEGDEGDEAEEAEEEGHEEEEAAEGDEAAEDHGAEEGDEEDEGDGDEAMGDAPDDHGEEHELEEEHEEPEE